jgi:predicted ATP-dependent protease
MSGAIYDNEAWEARVKEMEAKVAKAEEQSKEANTVIESKVESAKQKIVQKQVIVKQYIDREVVKYDNSCVIPKEFIEVHNKAATK